MHQGESGRPISPALVQQLVGICGSEQVIAAPSTLATYRSDAVQGRQVTPALAVLPADADEVAQVVRACGDSATPWTARGAGTGLSGGALAVPGGVLIVLSRLREIVSVDLNAGVVVAGPGVSGLALSRAVSPTHFFAPMPASGAVATLGGSVAANAGGARSLKYGTTADHVVGLDVVRSDGSRVQLRRDAPGYDLLGAFLGSEGTLGIAVAIHVRVLPVPESVRVMSVSFTSAARAAVAANTIATQLSPSALELVDATVRAVIAEAVPAAAPGPDRGAALLIEFDGAPEATAVALESAVHLCRRDGAEDLHIALDAGERAALWSARDASYVAMARVRGACRVGDVVLPPESVPTVLTRVAELSAGADLPVGCLLHAGEGNLHPIICFDPGVTGQIRGAAGLAGEITALCLAHGGSISGEHGIGEHVDAMTAMFAPADLAAFRRLRRAFDPAGLANPDKLLPPAALTPLVGV